MNKLTIMEKEKYENVKKRTGFTYEEIYSLYENEDDEVFSVINKMDTSEIEDMMMSWSSAEDEDPKIEYGCRLLSNFILAREWPERRKIYC